MTRTAIVFILVGFISWGAVQALTGEPRLADYTFMGIILFGYALLIFIFRKQSRDINRDSAKKLSQTLTAADAKMRELDSLKAAFASAAEKDFREPLSEVVRSLSLLLDGTYGTLPPAAKESVQQVFERAAALEKAVSAHIPHVETPKAAVQSAANASIRNLKVS